MTHEADGMLIIKDEPPQQCDLCGTIAELRPYGPNGAAICFACGLKNLGATVAAFKRRLDHVEGYRTE